MDKIIVVDDKKWERMRRGDCGLPAMYQHTDSTGQKTYRRILLCNGEYRTIGPEYYNWADMQHDEDKEWPLYEAADMADSLASDLRDNAYSHVHHPRVEYIARLRLTQKFLNAKIEEAVAQIAL